MSRRKVRTATYDGVTYERIPADSNCDFDDSQFDRPPPAVPWKALCLASCLCIGGTIILVVGSLLVSGHIDVQYADRTWPLIIMGALMFLPGAYHMRIAYCAFRGYPGYSYDDIPEFD